jgi:predicted permease
MAVRLSLGASRGRIARQMLTESTLLAVLGGALGVLLAIWGAEFLLTFRPPLGGPLALQIQPDTRVLGFMFALSLLTGLAFGIGPALSAAHGDLAESLREGRGTAGGRRLGMRGALVVAQVAITLVLLAGAGLLIQTLRNLRAVDVGYAENNVLVARVSLETRRLPADAGRGFFRDLNERIAGLPGVISVSLASTLPPSPAGSRYDGAELEGYTAGPDEIIGFDTNSVGSAFFQTVGMRIVNGRAFDERDVPGAPRVVIVNEAMAQRYWPGQNPIGRHILFPRRNQEPLALQIVGIAQDGKYRELREEPGFTVYFPLAQQHRADVALLVQTRDDPLSLVPAVRTAVRTLDPAVPLSDVTTLRAHVLLASSQERMVAALVSLFGALALGLAMLGVYGVVNYSVVQRTREIGVRMALGARRGDVLRMIVGRALTLSIAGIVLGIGGGLALAGTVRGLVFGVSETDPFTFAAVALLLTAITVVAAWLPARKALRIEPLTALR